MLLPSRAIRNQGDVNCCVSCAIGACLESAQENMPELAPLFHFHFAGGPGAIRTGVQISSARSTLLSFGICSIEKHRLTIDPGNVAQEPTEEARIDGRSRRPMDPARGALLWENVPVSGADGQWKRRLKKGAPMVAVVCPNPSYRTDAATGGHLLDIDGPYESIRHAIAVIGFSDGESAFLIQDSRGTEFGLKGQWWLPYELARTPFLESAFCFGS